MSEHPLERADRRIAEALDAFKDDPDGLAEEMGRIAAETGIDIDMSVMPDVPIEDPDHVIRSLVHNQMLIAQNLVSAQKEIAELKASKVVLSDALASLIASVVGNAAKSPEALTAWAREAEQAMMKQQRQGGQ